MTEHWWDASDDIREDIRIAWRKACAEQAREDRENADRDALIEAQHHHALGAGDR